VSKLVALLIALILLFGGGAWYWLQRAQRHPVGADSSVSIAPPAPIVASAGASASAPAPAASAATVAPVAPPVASAPARKLTLADVAQPPPDAPVKDVLRQLSEAANQGVPQAACRLGFELVRCGRVGLGAQALDRAQRAAASLPPGTPEAAAASRQAAQIAGTLSKDQEACRDVPDNEAGDAWRYLQVGAAAGSVAAMTRFVRDPGIPGPPGTPGTDDAWAAYRRDANQFLTEAIRAGDVRALYQGYVSAVTGQSPGGAGIFPRSAEKAIAYAVALRGLRDKATELDIEKSLGPLIDEVGPARASAARQQGEAMRADFFASAVPLDRAAADSAGNAADCWK